MYPHRTHFLLQIVDPVLSIAASLSVQSPFTMKAHRDVDAMVRNPPNSSQHAILTKHEIKSLVNTDVSILFLRHF